MSLLSYTELCELVERGVITNVEHDQINATSIDITLGDTIMVEDTLYHRTIDYSEREFPAMVKTWLGPEGHVLEPGQFILAQSQQVFNLPNDISAEYKLKSSMARIGLEHMNAGWCFTAGTLVSMLDGSEKPIEDIAPGEEVYSLDSDGKVRAGKVTWAGKTTEVASTVLVVLDDGNQFECTPEHRVMLRDGSYVEASELTKGQALMPLKRRYDTQSGHEKVYCPHTSTKSNWRKLHGRWEYTHVVVMPECPVGSARHHKNEVKTDNHTSNLEIIDAVDHSVGHLVVRNKTQTMRDAASKNMKKTNEKLWSTEGHQKRMAESSRAKAGAWNESLWSDPQHREKLRTVQAENGKQQTARLKSEDNQKEALLGHVRTAVAKIINTGESVSETTYTMFKRQNAPRVSRLAELFGSFRQALSAAGYENHKVSEVLRIEHEAPVPVYDITVDRYHNFALSAGVFVHNCDAGWNGSVLTLEFKNMLRTQSIRIRPGDRIGQIVFFKHTPVPADRSYSARGRYNNDKTVSGIKP